MRRESALGGKGRWGSSSPRTALHPSPVRADAPDHAPWPWRRALKVGAPRRKFLDVYVGCWGMPNRPAAALLLHAGDRAELERWSRSSSVPARLAQRARLVLMAADGLPNHEIAGRAGVSRPTVNLWRLRYAEQGLAGLADRKRPGRPRQVDTPDPQRVPNLRRGDPLLLDQTLRSVASPVPGTPPGVVGADRRGHGTESSPLVSAPAGFGKSTLLSTWAAAAPAGGRPVAWLSLDARDNDPARFWRYFVEALSRASAGRGRSRVGAARLTASTTHRHDLDRR